MVWGDELAVAEVSMKDGEAIGSYQEGSVAHMAGL